MKRRSTVSATIAVVASIVLAGSALAAFAGASNGSFEQGTNVDRGAGFQALSAPSSVITGWTIHAGSVDWIGTYWPAAAGTKSLDMNGGGPGTISQGLATTIGKTYVVTFSLSANPAGGSTVRALTVSATGARVSDRHVRQGRIPEHPAQHDVAGEAVLVRGDERDHDPDLRQRGAPRAHSVPRSTTSS